MSSVTSVFVITDHEATVSPDPRAAYATGLTIVQSQQTLRYDQLCIGSFSNGLIQSSADPERIEAPTERCLDTADWEATGEYFGPLSFSPLELLYRNTMTTDDVVTKMLRYADHEGIGYTEPMPHAVIEPDGAVTAMKRVSGDVFSKAGAAAGESIAQRYIDDVPGYAERLAEIPMRQLAVAQFRVRYLRTWPAIPAISWRSSVFAVSKAGVPPLPGTPPGRPGCHASRPGPDTILERKMTWDHPAVNSASIPAEKP